MGFGPAIDPVAAPAADRPDEADQGEESLEDGVDDLEAEQIGPGRRADPGGGVGPAELPALAAEALADPDRAAIRRVPAAVQRGHAEERPQQAAVHTEPAGAPRRGEDRAAEDRGPRDVSERR